MRIGVIDVDNHDKMDKIRFPNLPLAKLSAYHKRQGDTVEWYMPTDGQYDVAYLSKVFTFTKDYEYPIYADKVIFGGTGYDLHNKLPDEVEHITPDCSLYPQFNEAYGFLTRGCPRSCEFCIVSEKEGRCSTQVADLSEFWRGQNTIKLLDPNLLACRDREKLLRQLIDSRVYVDFTQGLDARCITNDVAKLICKMKISMVHFAFDYMKNEKDIVKGLTVFQKHFDKSDRYCEVYILTNYNTTPAEDLHRVKTVIALGYRPFVMIYDKGTHGRFLTDLARWANNPRLFRSCRFEDYVPRRDGRTCGEMYRDILNAA